MSFLNNFFPKKKTILSIVESAQRDIFTIYGVAKPTDAQKMKASVYICIAGIAILNDFRGGKPLRDLIDRLVVGTKDLTKPLSMLVGELANSKEELDEILTDFPKELRMSESTRVNGLAGFEALYFTKVEKTMNDILSHKDGPFGTPGYASIVVTNGIFGSSKPENFMPASMRILNFAKELSEAI